MLIGNVLSHKKITLTPIVITIGVGFMLLGTFFWHQQMLSLKCKTIIPYTITAVIGLIASTGSAAPPAMPYVAVAGSSGWSDSTSLLKYGFLMMFIIILVASFIGYPLANLIMPM